MQGTIYNLGLCGGVLRVSNWYQDQLIWKRIKIRNWIKN